MKLNKLALDKLIKFAIRTMKKNYFFEQKLSIIDVIRLSDF